MINNNKKPIICGVIMGICSVFALAAFASVIGDRVGDQECSREEIALAMTPYSLTDGQMSEARHRACRNSQKGIDERLQRGAVAGDIVRILRLLPMASQNGVDSALAWGVFYANDDKEARQLAEVFALYVSQVAMDEAVYWAKVRNHTKTADFLGIFDAKPITWNRKNVCRIMARGNSASPITLIWDRDALLESCSPKSKPR